MPMIHRPAWNMLKALSVLRRFLRREYLREVLGSSLKRAAEDTETASDLNVANTAEVVARPHQQETGDSAASGEQAICRRDGWSRYGIVALLAAGREVEVLIPARLADGAANDGRAISVRLSFLVRDRREQYGQTLQEDLPCRRGQQRQ